MTATEGSFDDVIREMLVELRATRKLLERIERAQPKPARNSAPIMAPRRICDPEVQR